MPESNISTRGARITARPVALPPAAKMAAAEARHDAAQRAHLLVSEAGPQKQVADVAHHRNCFLGRPEKTAVDELTSQLLEQSFQLVFPRRQRPGKGNMAGGIGGMLGCRLADAGRSAPEPFVGHQQHGLSDVERGEGRVDRRHHDHICQRDFLVAQTEPLAAEQDSYLLPRVNSRPHVKACLLGSDHGLHHIARARGRGVEVVKVTDGVRAGFEHPRPVDDSIGARSRLAGGFTGPSVTRFHDPQL